MKNRTKTTKYFTALAYAAAFITPGLAVTPACAQQSVRDVPVLRMEQPEIPKPPITRLSPNKTNNIAPARNPLPMSRNPDSIPAVQKPMTQIKSLPDHIAIPGENTTEQGLTPATAAYKAPAGFTDVVLYIKNVKNKQGNVKAYIYPEAGDFPLDFSRGVDLSAQAIKGEMPMLYNLVPAGDYAAVVYHDENKNDMLDKGMLGYAEGIGFSGGETVGFFGGLPAFEACKFTVTGKQAKQTIDIELDY